MMMKWVVSLLIVVIGLILLTSSPNINGESGGFILIGPVPIVFGSSLNSTLLMAALGMTLMIFFILFPSIWQRVERSSKAKDRTTSDLSHDEHVADDDKGLTVKGGGVIMIGPLPLVFSSDPRTVLVLMMVAMVLMLMSILILL